MCPFILRSDAPHSIMKIRNISRTEAGVPRSYKVTKGLKTSQTAAPTDNTKSSIREEVRNANMVLAAAAAASDTSTTANGSRSHHLAVVTKGLKKTRRPMINTPNRPNAPVASKKKPVGSSTVKIVPAKTKNKKQIETLEAEEDSQKTAPTDNTKSSTREEVEKANKVLAAAVSQSQKSVTTSSTSSLSSSLSPSSACGVDDAGCIGTIYEIRQWIRAM